MTGCNTVDCIVARGFHGWMAESFVELNAERSLQITTMKRDRGRIETIARVVRPLAGSCIGMVSWSHGDWSCIVMSRLCRSTRAAVEEQHREALQHLPTLIERARAGRSAT